ncbi:hypothetical protein X566_10175 [Afipia sp. P52-10]|uniref:DUF2336 domain-containing protein n=1 Tax=Afipia sp. P52-10 TaxID=1429916 RepID=UPI0003DF1E48|nr:DUF2336 domain-containing protein [Afipia sp. P52-10]ETR77987.1 hypothetical protein X566_10175 [Afipia sp. P52-10]
MLAASSSLPDLEEIVRSVTPERRAIALRKLGALFVQGASRFNVQHVALFDTVLKSLLPQADGEARAALAGQLAALANAPPSVVRELVLDAEIKVAGPLLRASPVIDEATLIEVVRCCGQAHLQAVAERLIVPESVTDALLVRGEREVVRSAAANAGALFSVKGYSSLVRRAADDGVLAMAIGLREDLPTPLLQRLLSESADIVRRRLFQTASPARRAAIARTMAEAVADADAPTVRDFASAQQAVLVLQQAGALDHATLTGFVKERKYEETVVAIAAVSGLAIDAVDRVIAGGRRDSILILGRALGLEWSAVRALLSLRLGAGRSLSIADIEDARVNFERLALPTAQRVVAFWKDRGQI